MKDIENVVGYFGQMTWKLAGKTALYALIFAAIVFLQGFVSAMPANLIDLDWVAMTQAFTAGLSLVYEQALLISTPFIISLGRTDKK